MELSWINDGAVLGCAFCTYERVLGSWYFVTTVKFLVVLFFAFRIHLDPVRILGLVALFEIFHFKVWRMLLFSSDAIPGVGTNGEEVLYGILMSGIPVVLLIWGASYLAYFRATPKVPLRRRNLVLFVPVLFMIGIIAQA